LSSCSREELSNFISTSVLPQTGQVYSKEFLQWKDFVKSETGSDDPLLTGKSDNDKAALVSLMMMRRHQGGKRGKAATSFTATIRLMFARTILSQYFSIPQS
jgi:RNase P/RNase MRP subunit POP5